MEEKKQEKYVTGLELDEKGYNWLISALDQNDLEKIKMMALILALDVRNKLEGFHDKLKDEEMKVLNPIIREGIFNMLFVIANFHKKTDENKLEKRISEYLYYSTVNIPKKWTDELEELKLYSIFKKNLKFKSKFLNEQYEIGNIYWDRGKYNECIRLEPLDSKEVNKITASLRKEGYKLDKNKNGYVQGLES